MKVWTPTARECEIIKAAAVRAAGCMVTPGQIRLEPLVRHNTDNDSVVPHINIARVSEMPDDSWKDTELFDKGSWPGFRKGVLLTDDGRAVIDFAIRPVNEAVARKTDDLLGNVIVFYVSGRIVSIRGCHARGKDYLADLGQGGA